MGNAEERLDAGCGIKRWKTGAKAASVFYLPSDIPQRINLVSRQAVNLSSK